jgi:hypothetical protein
MTEQPQGEAVVEKTGPLFDLLEGLDGGVRDFIEKLIAWSRELIVIVLVIVAAGYLYRSYQAGQIQRERAAGDRLGKLQALFEQSLVSEDLAKEGEVEKKEQNTNVLNENIRLLSDIHEPYKSLALLYEASVLRSNDDKKGALSVLKPLVEQSSSEGVDKFVNELAALSMARLQLDIEEKRSTGRELLRKLALESSFVAVPATISFASTSKSPSEEGTAVEVIKAVTLRLPEQRDLLSGELSRLEESLASDKK